MNSLKIKKEFIEDFIRAENTFLYQIVFDPGERRQVPLYDYPKATGGEEDCDEDEFVGVTMTDEKSVDYSYAGEIQASTVAMRLALGNRLGGPPMADKFILPEELPDWSIWSPSFKTGEERKRMKEEIEKTEKRKCGAFTLTSFVRKVRKTETSDHGKDSVEILEASTSKVEATIPSNSLGMEADDDFVSVTKSRRSETIKTESLQKRTIKSFFLSTSKEKKEEIVSEGSNRVKKIGCIGPSPRGNGAQRNWSCEDLLKMYKMDQQASNPDVSPVSSQDPVAKVAPKRSACSINLDSPYNQEKRPKQETNDDAEMRVGCMDECGNAQENDCMSKTTSSDNFVNRTGIRTSGLSRQIANPFKKVVVEEYNPPSQKPEDEIKDISEEKDPWRFHPTLGNSAYRASGLRRVSAVKENDVVQP